MLECKLEAQTPGAEENVLIQNQVKGEVMQDLGNTFQ